jgi:hypothetical protein
MIDLTIFDAVNADLERLKIDEIKDRLAPLIKGMRVASPIFSPGVFLYRARKISSTFNKITGIKYSDLIYPPKRETRLGRLNRDGDPVFYCSLHKPSIFFELPELSNGNEIILTFWKTTDQMIVNNIGYTQQVFERLGAKRPIPQWFTAAHDSASGTVVLPSISPGEIAAVLPQDENGELRRIFSECFMCSVGDMESHKYKLTTALGELHLGTLNEVDRFAGVLYPSVRMWANGDNLALLPWFVDRHLQFRKALHIRIDRRNESEFSFSYLDAASEFDENGNLRWLGTVPSWTLQPKQAAIFECKGGVDEDGDYVTGSDGKACHWTGYDIVTGEVIKTSLRVGAEINRSVSSR